MTVYAATSLLYFKSAPQNQTNRLFQIYFVAEFELPNNLVMERTLASSKLINPDPSKFEDSLNNYMENLYREIIQFCEQYKDGVMLRLDLHMHFKEDVLIWTHPIT